MDAEEKSLANIFLQDYKTHPLLLAAVFNCAYLTRVKRWDERRMKLRDFCRYYLKLRPYKLSPDSLESAWFYVGSLFSYNPPNPTQITKELQDLAAYENR